jgi:phosphoserine phosphatase
MNDACADQVDCALLPADCTWARFSLLASDMDSTLITIECIDEIADFCGKRDEVAAITDAAMRGEITNFEDSLRRRVALLRGVPESALLRVYEERLKLTPGAEALIVAVHERGIKTLLVSGGFTFFTDRLKQRLRLDFAESNVLEIQAGHLTGSVVGAVVDGAAKLAALESACAVLGVKPSAAIVLGDGANDLPMLKRAGLSVAYHAKSVVAAATDVAIRFGGLDVLLEWL